MTDEQIINIIKGELRKKSPLNLITDILKPNNIWNKEEEHRIKDIIDLMAYRKEITIIGGKRYFPATDMKIEKRISDNRQEILLHLFHNNGVLSDLRPLIKSLAMSRQEIINTFSILEHDGIVKSDKQWKKYKTISTGIEKNIDQVPFNFRLTTEGATHVKDMHIEQHTIQFGSIHIGDNVQNSSFRDFKPTTINPTKESQNSKWSKWRKTFSNFWWYFLIPLVVGLIILSIEKGWIKI